MIRHYPRPSAPSIRRTLNTLRDAGVIEETVSKDGELYYQINIHQNDLLTCADGQDD
jgi:Fe2+ or Zn2+ uptake regulation protein